ncbi:MAG: 6-carboxytetrahydropterin synthase QueD [Coriobacteriales bacterium]|jgi:6-pyruvoyltetrahydropterin/6-carboxytetrahydropterin synthase|nr:6-carboxytetrahydropterin synthase QueD [Coriobacteriales bacterium]
MSNTKAIKPHRAVLNTDGGSRGNPGISGIGFALAAVDDDQLVPLCSGGAYIGVATNNHAEYQALIWGLRNALESDVKIIDVYADSELVVKQLNGEYKVKNEGIKPLYAQARALLGAFESYTVNHVLREENAAADALANEAMDTREQVGDYCVPYLSGTLFDEISLGSSAMPRETKTNEGVAPAARQAKEKGTPMYTLTVKDHFDAAHALVGYPGECKNLHGHTWDIEVSVCGTQLDEVGIVYDFKDIKSALKAILDTFDHKFLNDIPPFNELNATAENLARVIFEQLEPGLPAHIDLKEVAVWESPIARLSYTRD